MPCQVLHGRLVARLPGYYGLFWYLVELDMPLHMDSEEAEAPWEVRGRRLRHLLLTPAPDVPTLEAPVNVIGESLARGEGAFVFVSAGPPPTRLPRSMPLDGPARRYPFLSMAEVESSR
ncbi:MAG TPA: hypothetical protein VFX28_20415 [Methylomirabilota bacterium]|nr:hypothetical protein [Methylomirabilota bacterium]